MTSIADFKILETWRKQSNRKQLLYYFVFGFIGIALFYFVLKDQEAGKLLTSLKKVNYWWAIPIFFISVFNNIIRSLRWLLLLKTMGYRPGIANGFNALMFGYMVNYAIPRMGEITRCIALNKGASIPFKSSFGTVITERIIDVLSLLVVCFIGVFWAYNEIAIFTYDNMIKPVINIWLNWYSTMLWVLVISIILVAFLSIVIWFNRNRVSAFVRERKLRQRLEDVWKGIISIKHVENMWLFSAYTIIIWLNYFLCTYLWFFAFDLAPSIKVGLVVMAMGSIAKSLPIQGGGLGAYHYVVTQAIIIFGFSELQGSTLAIVNHGFQTVYQIGLGFIGMLYFARNIKVMPDNTGHD